MFNTRYSPSRRKTLSLVTGSLLLAMAGQAMADPVAMTIKNSFGGPTAGGSPWLGGPTLGKDGDLYGLTQRGGSPGSYGAAYKLAADGTLTQLYAFQGNGDGMEPTWGLVRDSAGNFYGMADPDLSASNRGTVFKLTPSGTFTVLHSFPFDTTGGWAYSNAVTLGSDGYLYGAAFEGGTTGGTAACGTIGCGLIFRMKTDGSAFTVLYQFPGVPSTTGYAFDYPEAGLTEGPDGNFYGLSMDGNDYYGMLSSGSLYRMTPAGVVTQLFQFTDPKIGHPVGKPTLDAAGNLYIIATGSTSSGSALGFIYKLDTAGVMHTLHTFLSPEGEPGTQNAALLLGRDGRLYGTTEVGGAYVTTANYNGYGTVFSIDADGSFATLYNFNADAGDGFMPGGLVTAKDGSLWGTTLGGGTYASGTAYRLSNPTMKLSINRRTVTVGQSAKLTWSSTNAISCAASGAWGPMTLPASGSQLVTPTTVGTLGYKLTCSGAGSLSRTAKLTVN